MAIHVRKQTEYSLIEFLLDTELEYIKKYIVDQSILLRVHEQNVEELISAESVEINGSWYLPFDLEQRINSSYFTNNIFYKSTLITIYSFLESLLKEITRIEQKKFNLKLSPKDLKGQGVLQYKDYLKKVVQIDFQTLNSLWIKINDVRIVRNFLVHDYLDYSDRTEYKDIERITKDSQYIRFYSQNKTIEIIDKEYLLDFCTAIGQFTASLLMILKRVNRNEVN